jgi:chromosome segregation ATPase
MKRALLLPSIALLLLCSAAAAAQNLKRAEELRSQLRDIETQEAALRTRLQQLDESLKPENIERSLALNGSTRPEEVREQRCRQLEGERKSAQAQLDQLAASRARIENSILRAETEPYREGAAQAEQTGAQPAAPAAEPANETGKAPAAERRRPQRRRRARRRP